LAYAKKERDGSILLMQKPASYTLFKPHPAKLRPTSPAFWTIWRSQIAMVKMMENKAWVFGHAFSLYGIPAHFDVALKQ
jgi:hypothetical protein